MWAPQFPSSGKHFKRTLALAAAHPSHTWLSCHQRWPHTGTGYSSGQPADDTCRYAPNTFEGVGTRWFSVGLAEKMMDKIHTFATSSSSERPLFFGWKTSQMLTLLCGASPKYSTAFGLEGIHTTQSWRTLTEERFPEFMVRFDQAIYQLSGERHNSPRLRAFRTPSHSAALSAALTSVTPRRVYKGKGLWFTSA